MNEKQSLLKIDEATELIKSANIFQLKEIINKAEAIRGYLMRAKSSLKAQNYAAALKLRAERQIGILLPGKIRRGKPKKTSHDAILKDFNLNLTQSSRYQLMARIPEEIFEATIAEFLAKMEEEWDELTQRLMLEIAKGYIKGVGGLTIPRVATKDINLIKGDVLEVDIPEVDVIFTDPPYNVTGIKWDIIGTDKEYLNFTRKWIKRLRWNKHFFVFCSPKYMADYEIILRELNYPIQSRIIWVHKNMSMGKNAKDKFINCYDVLFHCGKTELNLPKMWTEERFDVKEFAVPQTNFKDTKLHQTQKPKGLIEEILRLSTKQGDIVLDCFAGSGSTGVVANELGLKCYLIEKEPKFIKLIEEHLCI